MPHDVILTLATLLSGVGLALAGKNDLALLLLTAAVAAIAPRLTTKALAKKSTDTETTKE